MADWRYLFYTLLGNSYIGELPLDNVAFDTNLGGFGTGSFAAELSLVDRRVRALPFRAATDAGEVVCYSECDGVIAGGHVVWDTTYTAKTQRLALTGSELLSYIMRRAIQRARTFAGVDQLDIVRQLLIDAYGDVNGGVIAVDPVGTGPLSGVTRDRTYLYGDSSKLGDIIDRLAKVIDGFDYSIAYDRDDLRIVSTVIHKLNAECRVGHIEIHVHLFQHLGVLMRRPARPVARFGDGETGDQSSRFDVFCQQHVQLAGRSRSASGEF